MMLNKYRTLLRPRRGRSRPTSYHTAKPGTSPVKKPRLFRVAYLSPIWLAATICVLLFTAYPANANLALDTPPDQNYTQSRVITNLILPAGTDGAGTLTYTLTGPSGGRALPAGLEFDADTRTLSGRPSMAGTIILTYTVIDTIGTSSTRISRNFTVTVAPGLALDTPGEQNYTQGRAITDLPLPEATNSTGTLTYTLTGPSGGALPGGLIFTPGTRTLSGTPSTTGTFTLTYMVGDANGDSTNTTFEVTVSPGLTLTASGNRNYTQGIAIIDLILPEGSGGTGTLTYTLTGPSGGVLPAGLDFDADTRTLSGTPNTPDTTILTYTVSDANGASTSVDFTVTVNSDLALDTPGDQNYTQGTEIPDLVLPEATGGTGTLTYTLSGTVPPGLTFTPDTRTLSGTPSMAGTFTLTYTVTDTNDALKPTASATFAVIVNSNLTLTAPDNQNYTRGRVITNLILPEGTGGTAPLMYSLTGLPSGLTFTPDTRTLSGTPNTAGTTLTYRVSDANGDSTNTTFTVTVNPGLTFVSAPGNQSYMQDTEIDDLQLPEATGGTGTLTYTLTGPGGGNLPAGLTFNANTRTLSGTPTTVDITLLTYRATDANGARRDSTFTVTVNSSLTLTAPANQNYTLDTLINDLILPAGTGGTAPLEYFLTGPGATPLPEGLVFDFTFGRRTLSGTPTTAGTTTLTYAVRDAVGTIRTTPFTVTINPSPALDRPIDRNHQQGSAISFSELPAATGGTAPLTYTLTGDLPAGLTFNPDTRTLSGTPGAIDVNDQFRTSRDADSFVFYSFTQTYTVTDTNGANTSVNFDIIFASNLTLAVSANQNYTQGRAINNLILPAATGGAGTLTYTLIGQFGSLPMGLDFNADTRTLSGRPSRFGTTTLTYTASETDPNGASRSVNFEVMVSPGLRLTVPANQNYTQDREITNLILPEGTGNTVSLTYTLTGPNGGVLPAGLTFNPDTRTLSGTPSTTGTTTLTYTASETDPNGASTNVTFAVTVNARPALTAPAPQTYRDGRAITDLQLPEATGGTGTLVYTLTEQDGGGLPAGLTFNADTRRLSGTPSTGIGTFTFTLIYMVSDANGASANATLIVVVRDNFALPQPDSQFYRLDRTITDLFLPAATGETGPFRYILRVTGTVSDLPPGLDFDASTRRLSGTPRMTGIFNLTYLAVDSIGSGRIRESSFTVRVALPETLALNTHGNQNYTQGTEITDLILPPATGGVGALMYTLTGVPSLPPGLTFTLGTRTLSGTPNSAGTFNLVYRVRDAGTALSSSFTVTVNASLALDTPDDQDYIQNRTIPDLQLPEVTGGTAPLQYTLTGLSGIPLPAGLEFDVNTRILSGTPSRAGIFTLTYRVIDANGVRENASFTATVNANLTLVSALSNQNYTRGTEIDNLILPEAIGGVGTLTYTLTRLGGTLPAGLAFNANRRTLSGTPSAADAADLLYLVSDTIGTSFIGTFTVIVNPRLTLTAPADQIYTLGTAITVLTLPEATGGTAPLQYTLIGQGGGAVTGGLTFDPSTRMLSGTPNNRAGFRTLTYRVTDTNGASTAVDFRTTIRPGLTLTAPNDQNYTRGTTITDLTLPEATGGTVSLTYTLTSVPGLNFNGNTRTLSGTPDTADTTTLTYRVTDTNGASENVTFTIIVTEGLALNTPGNQNYTLDTEIDDLQLPAATGGTGTPVYTLTGTLPAGLNFTLGTRTLSGTPSMPGTTTLTYGVTDTNGATAVLDFTVTVNAGLTLTASGDQNYTQGRAISNLQLPAATGGTAPLTYTLTSVPGLEFDADTRTLSGTPDTADTTTLTYRVTDDNGASASVDFMVIVSDGLALNARGNQNYTRGTAITDLQLPAATGGTATLTYTLTGPSGGNLPAGLSFDPGTRTLSGTPNTPGTFDLTYEVTDANGASENATFTVIVSDGLALTASDDQNYTQGTLIPNLTLPAATGGTGMLVYTLTGPSGLPGGLNFTAGTRTLSGTPDTADTITLTYRVTDDNGASASVDFTVIVNASLTLDTPANQNYTQGTAITVQLPEANGGTAPLQYTLTGQFGILPTGLTFTAGTRTLSGTPGTANTSTLTYRVTDANGASTSVDFTVTVSSNLALDTPANQNYTQGKAISNLQLPVATGGTPPMRYTLTRISGGLLPAGLTFDTRTLSGTPNTPGTSTLTYRVIDAIGTARQTQFTVTVNASLTLTASGNQNYTRGTEITGLELPVATGGTGKLTYTLTGPGGGNLPAGLNFTPGTRILSGTPSTTDTTTLTYEVIDANGASTSATFTVIVSGGLVLTASGDQNYTLDTAITDLQLPAATGGTGTLTYTLTGPGDSALPAGLNFTPGTRTLSGTPSTTGTTTLTYAVTDDNGASTSVDFMVIVSDGLALSARGDQNYTLDTEITALQLPAATGGTAPLTYTLTGPGDSALPAGLTFTPGTRMLSGTPSTAGTTTLTYEVTDDNGASTSVDFMVIVSGGLVLTASGDQNYTRGRAINNLQLPAATGGTGTLVYTLTGPGGLPGGLNFTAGTRTLSGTPDTADTTTLTYRVTDTNSASTNVDFTVIVSEGLALTASGNQNYTLDTAITALELPEATGGTAPLTYTLTGPGGSALPAGLNFTPGTRTLSGTPSTTGTTTLTYAVTDDNGASTSVDFMVIVSDGLVLTASGDQNYTRGTAITALQLPAATGGTAPLTYTLTGPGDSALPAGLTFTPGTRMLSGTPSTADTTVLTYAVTDTNGASTNVDFTVMVNDGLALSARGNQNYTRGTAITDLQLPAATGGTAPLTYTLTGPGAGNLPAGLTFNAGTRILSGTPDTANTTVLTYAVTDDNGASTSVDFMVIVSDGLALTASGNQNYTLDTLITALQLPIATGGTAPLTYTLTGPGDSALPAGLSFDPGTRTLSGTPNTAGTTLLTYAVTDTNGASTNATFTVIVSDGLALTASGNQNYTLNTAITDLELPIATGGTAPLTYTLTGPSGGNLPAGLNFNAGTRMLSGTPNTAGTTTLTYEVTDDNGASTSVDFMVIVSDGLALTASGNQNYTLDTAITDLELPIATGGTAPLTYTLTGPGDSALPAGLTFTPGTRMLSGTPSTADTTVLTYAVTDTNGASTNVDFTVMVNDGLALTASGNQNYTLDTAITGLELPIATGGTAPLTYTLTGPSGGNLPAGLTFNAGTRRLSGTPNTAGTTTLTYMVSDTNGASTSVDFIVIVSDGLALNARGNQNYTRGTAITDLQLPAATGGTGTLTYTLTGPSGGNLPAGLNFNANTRILSGTPNTAGTTLLTYAVTDTNGASTNATFTVIVSDGLALTASGNQNYTLNTAITALQLPAATGGTGTLTYTLTGPSGGNLPAGLNFNAGTRILSGTPTTAGTTTLTYAVTDANGASTSVDFMVIVSGGLALTASGNQNYTLDTLITALQLPAATGGTAPLTYTLTSVPGLDFNVGTRILSGTPSTAGTTTLTYAVTDANNASTNATFTVTVNAGLALTASGNQNYTRGRAITDLQLPAATGGTGTLTYTLTSVPGLNFNANTRILSGTPSTAGTTTLTYAVSDANNASQLAIFTIAVADEVEVTAPNNQTYTMNTAITNLTLPEATGGTTPLTYTLTPLPDGLTFTTGTRVLSGTPTTANTTVLTYTATDDNGSTAMDTFTLTVEGTDAPPAFVETAFSQAENATPTLTLAATEADGDDVSFTLQSGRDAAYFTLTDGGVSADTAALVFRRAPNFENPQSTTLLPGDAAAKNTYQINVRAASTTSPNAEQTITQIITINVTDVDDPPTFTTAADALMIMEGETALTVMIEVIDQDGDPVTLALTGGADQARLRLTGSALSFIRAPDFENAGDADANNIYAIEITAISTSSTTTTGTGAIVLSAVRTFNITVTDADDNAPEFTSPTAFQIQSGETAVATLEATDADAGDTETIVFALSGGADQTQFTLTSAGVLSFTSAADFAEPTDADGDNIYAIEITLTSGSRPHTAQVALEIEVINIDRQSRQRIGNVILAHIARNLADNTQDVISARTSDRLTNHLALNNQQGNFNDLVGGIQGFSFMRRLDAKQAAADAKQAAACTTQTKTCGFTLWGKGHIRAFSASPNERAINSFSGHTYNLNLGADYQNGIFLFGGLITASQSNVQFTSGSAEGEGKIRTKLTTFSPYVHFRFKSGTELWGSAGFGQGRMRYQSETTGGFERTDLKYAQVAGGLYQPLKALQKTNLALRVDGYTARLKADAKEDVFLAMAGDVSRVRALLEIEHAWQGAYYSLTSKLNGGARLETGDIGKGIGFEFGVEIAYVNPACGFSVSADINTILLHTAQRYRHLDAGLRLLLDPGTKKRGLQFRLEPRIGGTTSAAPLWDGAPVDGSASPVQQLGTSGLGQLQTALGLSYGFAARQSLLTPFTEMRLDDRGAPIDFMLGMRFSRANLPINITLYAQKVFRSGAAGTSLGSDIGAATTPGTTPGVHLRLNWR